MKFKIIKTSTRWTEEISPFPGSIQAETIWLDKRTCSEAKIITIDRNWFKIGSNHREINGKAIREFKKTIWIIEVSSLDALLKLLKYYKCPLIVSDTSCEYPEYPHTIEIYDDYRE